MASTVARAVCVLFLLAGCVGGASQGSGGDGDGNGNAGDGDQGGDEESVIIIGDGDSGDGDSGDGDGDGDSGDGDGDGDSGDGDGDSGDGDGDSAAECGNDAECDDGQWCNGTETCGADGRCEAGVAPDVDDGLDCTSDSCDEDADTAVHTPVDASCDDGAWCNGAEYCDVDDGCMPGTPPNVDDGVDCTADSCDEGADAPIHTPIDASCNDGAWCNGVEYCDAGYGCRPGVAPNVDDGVDCTRDWCDEAVDDIVHGPEDALCDDGDGCTIDSCNPQVGCEHVSMCGGVLITQNNDAYGHHGACEGWNGCGDADTCALWACLYRGYEGLVSWGRADVCDQFDECYLFNDMNTLDENWGNGAGWCPLMGVGQIYCY